MKPPLSIIVKETGEEIGAACGTCGTLHMRRVIPEEPEPGVRAASCCQPDRCVKCAKEFPPHKHHVRAVEVDSEGRSATGTRHYIEVCAECSSKLWKERLAREGNAAFEAAEKISMSEHLASGGSDGAYYYLEDEGNDGFLDLEAIEELVLDRAPSERPKFVWATTVERFKFDLEEELTDRIANGDWYDGAVDMLPSKEALSTLQTALDVLLEPVVQYHHDAGRVILLDEAWCEAVLRRELEG